MIPYNEKIWGVHPREITAAWCARFVPLPNLEQVIAGAVGAGPPEMGYNQSFLYPKSGGIETFTRALLTRVAADRVHTRSSPDAIDWRRREVTVGGERFKYRALVATIPLPELLKRMTDLPPEIETQAARLRCTTLRYLNIGARGQPPADWHWIYVPEKRYPFYRVNVFSTAMPSMAPRGVLVDLRRDGRPRADPRRGRARHGGGAGGGGRARATSTTSCSRSRSRSNTRTSCSTSTTTRRRGSIFAFLEQNAIHPRGRYGAWTYNAMEDCVLAGREVAALIDSTETAA